jgi:hypothetical protein
MTSAFRERLQALSQPPPPHILCTDDRWECLECGAYMEQDRAFGPESLRHTESCPSGGDAPRVNRAFLKEVLDVLLEMEETRIRLERELHEARVVIRGVLYARV